jgi:branched-subunit amino acid transport protein AzlD
MAMLAIYSVTTVVGDTALQLLWLALAVAVTAGLQLWRGGALVSILAGTACYVTLMTAWGG